MSDFSVQSYKQIAVFILRNSSRLTLDWIAYTAMSYYCYKTNNSILNNKENKTLSRFTINDS